MEQRRHLPSREEVVSLPEAEPATTGCGEIGRREDDNILGLTSVSDRNRPPRPMKEQHPNYMPCEITREDRLKALETLWKTDHTVLNSVRPMIVAKMLPMIDGLVIQ